MSEDSRLQGRVLSLNLSSFEEEILAFRDLSELEVAQVEEDLRSLFSTETIMGFTNLSDPGSVKTEFELYVTEQFWVLFTEKESYCWSERYRVMLGVA